MPSADRKVRFGVVDDEERNHEKIKQGLNGIGEFVFNAYSYEAARESIHLLEPGDIVFVDGKLHPDDIGPEKGIEIVFLIKKFQPEAIVIWISGHPYPRSESAQPDHQIAKYELYRIGLLLQGLGRLSLL